MEHLLRIPISARFWWLFWRTLVAKLDQLLYYHYAPCKGFLFESLSILYQVVTVSVQWFWLGLTLDHFKLSSRGTGLLSWWFEKEMCGCSIIAGKISLEMRAIATLKFEYFLEVLNVSCIFQKKYANFKINRNFFKTSIFFWKFYCSNNWIPRKTLSVKIRT